MDDEQVIISMCLGERDDEGKYSPGSRGSPARGRIAGSFETKEVSASSLDRLFDDRVPYLAIVFHMREKFLVPLRRSDFREQRNGIPDFEKLRAFSFIFLYVGTMGRCSPWGGTTSMHSWPRLRNASTVSMTARWHAGEALMA